MKALCMSKVLQYKISKFVTKIKENSQETAPLTEHYCCPRVIHHFPGDKLGPFSSARNENGYVTIAVKRNLSNNVIAK